MRFDLQYGAGLLPLEISERISLNLSHPVTCKSAIDIDKKLLRVIENPHEADSLSHIVSHANSVAIVVNGDADIELTNLLLSKLLYNIRSSISRIQDLIVIYPSDSKYTIPDDIVTDIQLIQHDINLKEESEFIGETPTYSTPVQVNSAFLNSDITIGLGTIRSSIFVGATGGRMSVIPHCANLRSILRNTKLQATHPVGPFLTDNAVNTDLLEASQLAGLDFIINAIPDWKNNINDIVAGNPYSSWIHGVSVARSMTESFYKHKADIAIVSAGGTTYDTTLFDAVDALYSGKEATEHGGVIVLVAECANGIGPNGFMKGVSECNSEKEVSLLAETNFENGMEKSRFFWEILKSRKLIICSRLRQSLITERFHSSAVKDPQEGYEVARSLIVSSPRVAVIPHGIRTLPIMKNG